uniref:Venom toxin OcyC11 n=1 Tax=Zeugodacus cucurbitae TaxID=28588 RepID=A0A0A1X579_ZEUCU
MNFVNFLLCAGLLCLVGGQFAEAWMARGNYHNDAHPGKCVISDTIILSPGEKAKSPKSCSEVRCGSEQGHATIYGCGAVVPPEGCKWGDHVNIDAPFQECCARHLICDGGLTDENRLYQQHIWDMFSRSSKKTVNE